MPLPNDWVKVHASLPEFIRLKLAVNNKPCQIISEYLRVSPILAQKLQESAHIFEKPKDKKGQDQDQSVSSAGNLTPGSDCPG